MLWFSGSLAIFLVFGVQTITGVYSPDEQRAWGWLVPLVAPILTLLGSFYFATAFKKDDDRIVEKKHIYYMCLSWSAAYLGVIFCIICSYAFAPDYIFTLFEASSIFLGVFQGIVTAFLVTFFATERAD